MMIDSNLVANPQYYQLVSSLCKCIICEGILYKPIKCNNCDNSFCQACLDSWKSYSSICPFRCSNPIYSHSNYTQKILSKLMFECEKNCMTILYYDDYLKHVNYSCPNINYKELLSSLTIEFNKILLKNEIHEKKNVLLKDKLTRLETKKKKSDNTIISQSHLHPLIYEKKKNSWLCDLCKKHNDIGMKCAYCSKCDFDLCLHCLFQEFTSS